MDDLRYDGAGARIEQRTVQGGTTTTTYYLLGGQEEVQIVSGGATTITKNYPTGAGTHLPQPIKVGTTLSYLATDGLDTVSEAVDSAGNVTAQQLYLPYGGSRYTSGTMPTSKGYTGQRADVATGLDYYGACYYDPVVGQFTLADDVLPGDGLDPWGLSRYAYVEGNPIAKNDPSGHMVLEPENGGVLPWTSQPNYRQQIDAHRDEDGFTKVAGLHSFVIPDNDRADQRELDDGSVLSYYFGVTVYNQPESRRDHRSDYTVGVTYDVPYPSAKNRGEFIYSLAYPTNVELYTPEGPTSAKDVKNEARKKGREQAPIVVIDVSNNQGLNAMTDDQLYDYAASIPQAGKEGVVRVMIIRDYQVVADYDPIKFGPSQDISQATRI